MKILLVHQNFPGQFARLLPALLDNPSNQVVIFTMNDYKSTDPRVSVVKYAPKRASSKEIHPWVGDIETKVIRAEAAFKAAKHVLAKGYVPDIIYAHPGWGESLFLKEVWPKTPLVIYCEFFYSPTAGDVGFDKEFHKDVPGDECRIFMKNANQMLHFQQVDAGISPTAWQRDSYPLPFRSKIQLCHDGIDSRIAAPNPQAALKIGDMVLSRNDEILTFVNRTLEPYRGYHVFMRALPTIMRKRPNLKVLIVGRDVGGYGAKPEEGQTWKQIFLNEVQDRLDMSRVFFLGNIPFGHYIRLLQISTVHVYLTYPFVLSWSLLEAMSTGCAIVASDTPPVREVIQNGENGVLVDFFDTEALAQNVCNLLGDNAKRTALGAKARQSIVENYEVRKLVPKLVAYLEKIAG